MVPSRRSRGRLQTKTKGGFRLGTAMTEDQIRRVEAFHGHRCPGLAWGIRAAEWALKEVGRAGDEDVVTVAETDMCGVDALQVLLGCTL